MPLELHIVFAIVEIFGIFALGWVACHLGYIREAELDRWSRFVVDFLMPCLVFSSIVSGLEVERFRELAVLPLVGLGMIVFGSVVGVALKRGLRTRDADIRKTFHHFCAINNYGFLPIIIVSNLWGAKALANLFLLNLGSAVGFWTLGVGILGDARPRRALRNIFSINLFALVAALVVSLGGWADAVPSVLLNITTKVGAAAVPCMLLLVGATMHPLPSMSNKRDLAYLAVVRLVVLPILIVWTIGLLPDMADDVRRIAIVVSLMPTAVSSTVITRRYGGSPTFAVQAAVLTTLLSILTVPLLMHYML